MVNLDIDNTRKSNLSVSSFRKSVNESDSSPDLHANASLQEVPRDKDIEGVEIDKLSD